MTVASFRMNRHCIICCGDVTSPHFNIYQSRLNNAPSIYPKIVDVIGPEKVRRASLFSHVMCSRCVQLFERIDVLEQEVAQVKTEIVSTFDAFAKVKKEEGGESLVCEITTNKEETRIHPCQEEVGCESLVECEYDKVTSPAISLQVNSSPLQTYQNFQTSPKPVKKVGKIHQDIENRRQDEFFSNGKKLEGSSGTCSLIMTVDGQNTNSGSRKKNVKDIDRDMKKEGEYNREVQGVRKEELIKAEKAVESIENSFFVTKEEVNDERNQMDLVSCDNTKSAVHSLTSLLLREQRSRRRKKLSCLNEFERPTQMSQKDSEQDNRIVNTLNAQDILQVKKEAIACELCGEVFADMKQLKLHCSQVHAQVYSFTCPSCPSRYKEKAKLTRHMQNVHNMSAHQCQGCAFQASSQNVLDKHILKEHPKSRFFKCWICHKSFSTHRYLHVVHIKRCHYGLPIKYSCHKCGKGFVDKSSFENHKITHSESKNFACEFCGAMFKTPYALRTHRNTHTREVKYCCTDCNSEFLHQCNLIAHRKRFHLPQEHKVVCEICGKAFAARRDLYRHQLGHAQERPYQCSECNKNYTTKEGLKTHLRIHTGERPYKCSLCKKGFHKSALLRRHERSVHGKVECEQMVGDYPQATHLVSDDLVSEDHTVVITVDEQSQCTGQGQVYTVPEASVQIERVVSPSQSEHHADKQTFIFSHAHTTPANSDPAIESPSMQLALNVGRKNETTESSGIDHPGGTFLVPTHNTFHITQGQTMPHETLSSTFTQGVQHPVTEDNLVLATDLSIAVPGVIQSNYVAIFSSTQ
ncbi:uncharacterized protein LOC143028550 [Oratosquilla oratoria]|uniref:uncharacterized protein LOC143028550 n=1 Tax=Oratosquilla oratoria TaxID=337810 RepID=UPI003F767B2B